MDAAAMGKEVTTLAEQAAAWVVIAVPSFVGAVIVLIVGWWLASWSQRTLKRLLQNRVEPMLCGVVTSIVRYAILILVLVAVLGQLGIQTTSILAALGAAGLAIGLALQGTLQNIAAGMMLLWLRPFRVGDYIDTGSAAGTVKDVGLFASELHSWDGIYLFVPNSQIWNTRIINYSRLPTRLVDLQFGVSYGDDLTKGQEVLLAMARADDRVHADPAPMIFVDSLGDSAVVLRLRCWTANSDYWTVLRALTERGKHVLEDAGLSIPFPQRDLNVRQVPPQLLGGQTG